MSQKTYFSKACEDLGGREAVALLVGVSRGAVDQCARGERPVPPAWCVEIESESRGKYTCKLLNPDVCWTRVPDPDWPWHPEGRPLINPALQKAA